MKMSKHCSCFAPLGTNDLNNLSGLAFCITPKEQEFRLCMFTLAFLPHSPPPERNPTILTRLLSVLVLF